MFQVNISTLVFQVFMREQYSPMFAPFILVYMLVLITQEIRDQCPHSKLFSGFGACLFLITGNVLNWAFKLMVRHELKHVNHGLLLESPVEGVEV